MEQNAELTAVKGLGRSFAWGDLYAADDAQVDELEKYGKPPDVPATVSASVPLPVIGEPATEIKPPVND
jgi:hypothetical protein